MAKRQSIEAVKPAGKWELHKQEFCRSVKDLSTTELEYRATLNSKALGETNTEVRAMMDHLATAKKEIAKLEREREVLNSLLRQRATC